MPYGQGGRLGERIDPRLMQVDFSGIAQAGATAGNAMAQAGYDIGNIMKQRGQADKFIKKSEKLAKDISELIPELEPQARAALEAMNHPDASLRDRLAIAESVKETLQIGLMGEDLKMQKAAMAAKMQGGDSMMVLSPQEIDEFRKAGYSPEVIGRNPDGSLVVKKMGAKGAGSGGMVPFYNPETGTFGMQQQAPPTFAPTPGAGAAGGIENALYMPSAGGGFAAPDSGVSMSGDGGVLPPRPGSITSQSVSGPVPNVDIFDPEGKKAIRVPESMRDIDYKLKEQQLEKEGAETDIAKSKLEADKAKEMQGRKSFSSYVSNIANAYSELDKAGSAISTDRSALSNIKAFAAGSGIGQQVGAAVGSPDAAMRSLIKSQTPGIINVIRQSSEMGAKGMDTDAERKFYLNALGDQQQPVEANVRALIELDKAYGEGKVADVFKKKNPSLFARAMAGKFSYSSPENDSGPSLNDETEKILKELGL